MTYKERIAITVPNPDANEKTIFNDAADGLLKTKDSSGVVETLATTEGLTATEPKVYIALLTQSGTDAPVATVLKNTLGGTVVFTRDEAGTYLATLAGVFTLNKTAVYFTSTALLTAFSVSLGDVNVLALRTSEADDQMFNTTLKIEVYP